MFIKGIEEGGGYNFLTDLQNLPGYLWNPSNPTSTYLGAYEAFLRERYTFEHQIVDQYSIAIESCVDLQTQMLVLYSEYYGYKKKIAEEQGDYDTYKEYTPAYFSNVENAIVSNVNAMVESIGIGYFLVPDELTADEIAAAKEINPQFIKPETIDYKVQINGTTYDAYRVRDNKTLTYYIIFKKSFTTSSLVKQYRITENGNGYSSVVAYRPEFMLTGEYTDNGQFKMISSMDELTFVRSNWTDLRKELRETNSCGLEGISSSINKVLLFNNEWDEIGRTHSYTTFTMHFGNNDLTDKNVEEVTSRTVLENKSYQALVVYRDIITDMNYNSNVLKINDVASLSGQTIHVSGSQTLDISTIDKNPSNVTIIVTGSGTIKSNSKITLEESNIIITNTESDYVVTIENLKVNAKKYSEAALTIKTSCTVNFLGECSFNGTSSYDDYDTDIFRNYTKTRPIYACHGIITDGDVILKGSATVTATGKTGGAGICFSSGNLTIDGITLSATGSTAIRDVNTVGAGIGPCVTYSVTKYYPSSMFKQEYDYIVKSSIICKGDSSKNNAGKLTIQNATVTSSGVGHCSCDVTIEEIGGVRMIVGAGTSTDAEENHYYCFKDGKVANSKINLTEGDISSRIDTFDENNLYNPEPIEVTAYTKGKSGTTTKGIEFKLYGEEGTSKDWINADEIGNDKGISTQIVTGAGVGKINNVVVKTRSSNGWYPEYITIKCKLSGYSITLYVGRWIYDEEVTLSPTDDVYELQVKTGTDDGAGTDSDIYVQLRDKKGNTTEKLYLSEISQYSDAFENGDSDTFKIYVPSDFGECTQVLFYSNHAKAHADWLLDYFIIKKVQGEDADEGFTYYANQWFIEDKTLCFGKYSGSTGQFYLEVKTANKSGAGTDSNIWLTLYGTNGNTEAVNITKYTGDGNNFEKNDKDCFNIAYEYANIGTINKIVIKKDNDGSGPDWYLDYIKITEMASYGQKTQSVTFNIDQEIEDKSYTFGSSYMKKNTRQSVKTLSREVLSSLEKYEDGSYALDVYSNITISKEVFAIISQYKAIFTLNMKNDNDELLYSVTFDGNKFETNNTIEFKSGYSSSNGSAIIDFLAKAKLSTGTILKINTVQFGFSENESICVLQKDEEGWIDEIEVDIKDGTITLNLEEGKQLLLKKHNSAIPSAYETEADVNNNWIWISCILIVVVVVATVIIVTIRRKKQSSKTA